MRPPSTKTACLLLFLFFLFYLPVSAQFSLLYQKDAGTTEAGLGKSVAGAGDVDGDGTADFIVGAPQATPDTGIIFGGSAFVYSGATGLVLYRKNGFAANGGELGYSVAGAGDVDGDGTADFIIGAPYFTPSVGRDYAGAVFVYSGATGLLLHQKIGRGGEQVGRTVAGPGDIDGDGKADFLVNGATGILGSVFLYSGASGSLLYQENGVILDDNFGFSVAGGGEVNGDGIPDFIIGAYGEAYVYSGATGSRLYRKNGPTAGDWFGYSVAGAGDVDADGRADIIVGAPFASPGGRSYAGSAFVFSGASGSLLYQENGDSAYGWFGSSVAGAGDVNGDGRPDFIVGAPLSSPGGRFRAGSAYLYSGATGVLLFQKDGAGPDNWLGESVAGVGDINGDGNSDFIIGAPTDFGVGSVYVYGFTCPVKGDINADSSLTPADVMLLLNCVFVNSGDCGLCFADVNCDGELAPADVVLELLGAILRKPFPC